MKQILGDFRCFLALVVSGLRKDPLKIANEQLRWLSDKELACLLEAIEAEQIDRMAVSYGYYDTDLEMWVSTTGA